METNRGLTDTVLLLDNYGEDSEMLHLSFRRAGFTGPVVVIEDDGFFPEDVISVYQYFCGDFRGSGRMPGKHGILTRSMFRTIGKSAEIIPAER